MSSSTASESHAKDGVVDWILSNQLKAVFYTWGAGMSASMAYQWSRPIPTNLKVIHSRIYAQALTIGALGGLALLEFMTDDGKNQHDHHKRRSGGGQVEY